MMTQICKHRQKQTRVNVLLCFGVFVCLFSIIVIINALGLNGSSHGRLYQQFPFMFTLIDPNGLNMPQLRHGAAL